MSQINNELTLTIQGMDCAGCARSIETGVAQLNGVDGCELNFTTEKLRVRGAIERQTIVERVQELGFSVAEPNQNRAVQPDTPTNFFHYMWQRNDTRLTLIGAMLILPGLIFDELLGIHLPFVAVTSLAAMLAAGLPIARSAWRTLTINREININVLMTIAAIGAVIIGAYTEAGMVMVLFALGESLEGYTASRARQSIRSLMAVVPNEATLLDPASGQETRVNINDLLIGQVIVVKPGERIPMDGRVIAGYSSVDQAPITGESKPIEKGIGAEVFAGSINSEGVLEVEVTHLASDNTISRLIKMVEEAQEKRAPSQRFIDQFAKYYTPAVVAFAALVAIVPPLFFDQPFWNPNPDTFGWLYRGLALLVVACPCALVISTPVSIISAISNAASRGVMIKGGAYLETLSRIKAVAIDKTGTLTKGQPKVVALRAAVCEETPDLAIGTCYWCDDVLALASAVERRSEHPFASAILNQAEARNLHQKYPTAEMVQALTGKGVMGQVNGASVVVGSHSYFDEAMPHPEQACQSAQASSNQGYTPLLVGSNDDYLGTITVADTIRPDSPEVIAHLKESGVVHSVMLTGDNQWVAEQIAAEVGVTDVRAELLPENKVQAVEQLQLEYGSVAMVGDGINDTPALATASVGIAIGGAGNAQAMETADITLMNDDLRQLPFLFKLSQTTMRTIFTNVAISIGLKGVFLILVILGLSTMWMAVLADMGTSLLVTLNGMRLLRYQG